MNGDLYVTFGEWSWGFIEYPGSKLEGIALQKKGLYKPAFRKSGFFTLVCGFCLSLFLETIESKNYTGGKHYSSNKRFGEVLLLFIWNAFECMELLTSQHQTYAIPCFINILLSTAGISSLKQVRWCDFVIQSSSSNEFLISTELQDCHPRPL